MDRGMIYYRRSLGRPDDPDRKEDLVFWADNKSASYIIEEIDEAWVWILKQEEGTGADTFSKLLDKLSGSSPTALLRKTLTAIRKDGWTLGVADGGRTFHKEQHQHPRNKPLKKPRTEA